MEQERTQAKTQERTDTNVHIYKDHYEKERIYVRQVGSMRYTLTEERRERLEKVPRVFTPSLGEGTSENWKIIDPGDETFRTQSLHVHFVTVQPNGRNDGHGHQNEALFYVLEGNGYEMHDGIRYDWNAGDCVAVHNDSVHWHNNPDSEKRAVCLVMKPKPLALFLGLWQQGKIGTKPADDENFEAPMEWLAARPEGDELIPKVMKPEGTPWEWTPLGYTRQLAGNGVPLRIKGVDAYLQEIPGGSHSGKRWEIPDEAVFVLEGEGYDLHWDVEAEIGERYFARVAKKPTKWEWKKGDVIWVPQNQVIQRFNSDPTKPAKIIAARNGVFKHLGYSRSVFFENAPEYDALQSKNGA